MKYNNYLMRTIVNYISIKYIKHFRLSNIFIKNNIYEYYIVTRTIDNYKVTIQLQKIFNSIKVIIKNSSNFTNNKIRNLSQIILKLNLSSNKKITDDGIRGLINISKLNLSCNTKITDDGIRFLSNISELNLS